MFSNMQRLTHYLSSLKDRIGGLHWLFQTIITPQTTSFMRFGVIFTVLTQLIGSCFYVGLNAVVTRAVQNDPLWGWWAIGFLGLFLANNALIFVDFLYRENAVGRLTCDLDAWVNRLWIRLRPSQHVQHSSLLSPASFDADRGKLVGLAQTLLFDAPEALLTLPIQLIFLAIIDVRGFLCAILGLIGAGVASVWANEHLMRSVEPIEEAWKQRERYQTDVRTNIIRVLMSGAAGRIIESMNEDLYRFNHEVDRPAWKGYHQRVQLRMLPVLCAWGGYLAWALLAANTHTIGQIGVIITVTLLVKTTCEQIRSIARYERAIFKHMGCFDRIKAAYQLMQNDAPQKRRSSLHPGSITIQIEQLNHTYPGTQNPVLQGINFKIPPGTHAAVIGATGSGKSTLAQLIAGFATPTSGTIQINGVPTNELDLETWWQRLAFITQTPHLLSGTVRDNLRFGLPLERESEIGDADLLKACEAFAFPLDQERFKDGLDTQIGRGGVELSGGEKQRLMIAAASLRKASFIIIDEATSALDEATQRTVQEALHRLLQESGAGSITIAHRLSTIRDCTLFLVLNPDGTQEGVYTSWQEAVERSPMLQRLLKAQGG